MKDMLKKFLIIFVIGILSQPYIKNTCLGMEEIKNDTISYCKFGLNPNIHMMNIIEWDKASFIDAVKEIFSIYLSNNFANNNNNTTINEYNNQIANINRFANIQYRGHNINRQDIFSIIEWMMNVFINNFNVPHMACVRVNIIDANNNCYVYPIPYIFCSGKNYNNALTRWMNVAKSLRNHNNIYLLNHFLNTNNNTVSKLFKFVGNYLQYNWSRTPINDYHSERCIGMSFFINESITNNSFNIQAIVNMHQLLYNPDLNMIIIQIKTIKNICGTCYNFLIGQNNEPINFRYAMDRLGMPYLIRVSQSYNVLNL